MKLSVMLFPFHKQLTDGTLTPEKAVKGFQSVAITAIEPMMSWVEAQPAKWAAFDETVRAAGMTYSCYDIGVNLVGENEADRAKALDTVTRGMEFAKEKLRCPIVLLAGTKPATGMSNEDGRKIYGEQLAKAHERNRKLELTITIEDFGVYPPFTAAAAHCMEVLKAARCPEIRFTFDNGNFLFADDQPTQIFDLVKDRIAHVHIKDFMLCPPEETKKGIISLAGKRYAGCPIGDGKAEVAACLRLLKGAGYKGWISLEVGGGMPPLDDALLGAARVIEAWGKA